MAATTARAERVDRTARVRTDSTLDYRPSYLAAAITGAVIFVMYLLTMAPRTAMWDASEYIAVAYGLGIPHPPGNPFFVLIGRVFSILPIAPSIGMRINILAALSSAVSAGMWFLVTERVLVGWFVERWQRIAMGATAAIIGASAFTVWHQSVVNEKVYTVSLLFFAIVSWLMVRWSDEPEGFTADRILVLVAYLIGLGYANHPAGFLVGPAVGVAVLARRPQTLLRWKLLLACVAALALGVTPFIYQPLRAPHFPAINMGEPTACRDGFAISCTLSAETWRRLNSNISREQYGKPNLVDRQAPFTAQVGMWWLYFRWQWIRDVHGTKPVAQTFAAVVFLALGLLGGYVHWIRDRRSFWFFGSLVFTVTLLLIFYMNFKYGASQAPQLGNLVPREVRDRDYFYLWSFSTWSVWAALGLAFVWSTVATLIAGGGKDEGERLPRHTSPTRRHWIMASAVLAIALLPLVANAGAASRRNDLVTSSWAHDLLNSVEPYGVLVTVGDNDTFPLWYAQEVEKIRQDVLVVNTSLANTDWYVRQLIRRPVFEYDVERGPAVYRDGQWTRPPGPPMAMTIDQADSIPLYLPIRGVQRFQAGTLIADIDPRALPYGVLERSDLVVLQILRDNMVPGGRPVYISRTAPGYGDQLGLGPYLLNQGLARKVLPAAPQESRDTVLFGHEGWVDISRSRALWDDVFIGPEAVLRLGDWVDRPSVSIPAVYVTTGMLLAESLAQTDRRAEGEQVMQRVYSLADAARIRHWLQPQPNVMPLPGVDAPQGIQLETVP